MDYPARRACHSPDCPCAIWGCTQARFRFKYASRVRVLVAGRTGYGSCNPPGACLVGKESFSIGVDVWGGIFVVAILICIGLLWLN